MTDDGPRRQRYCSATARPDPLPGGLAHAPHEPNLPTARPHRRRCTVLAVRWRLESLDKSSSNDSGKKEYSIAFVGPLTGDSANLGIFIRNGAKTAIQEFNAANPTYKITLKEFDTQGDPAEAPTVLDKYINDDKILGHRRPAFSGETKAVLPTLEENGLVMVSASATNTELPDVVKDGKVFHRVLPEDAAQAAGHLEVFQDDVEAQDDRHRPRQHRVRQGGRALDVALKQLGDVKLVDTEAIDPKSQDYSAAVNKVKAANPDVVFYGGYYEQAGRLKKQLTDANVRAQFISGDGSLDTGFVKAAGSAANGALLELPVLLRRLTRSGCPGWRPLAAWRSSVRVRGHPGHAEGHLSLWDPAARVLFSGDHLLAPHHPRPQPRTRRGAAAATAWSTTWPDCHASSP